MVRIRWRSRGNGGRGRDKAMETDTEKEVEQEEQEEREEREEQEEEENAGGRDGGAGGAGRAGGRGGREGEAAGAAGRAGGGGCLTAGLARHDRWLLIAAAAGPGAQRPMPARLGRLGAEVRPVELPASTQRCSRRVKEGWWKGGEEAVGRVERRFKWCEKAVKSSDRVSHKGAVGGSRKGCGKVLKRRWRRQ